MRQLTLTVPGELTATAMELVPGKLTFEKWASIGTRLREMNTYSRWWLGDWVLYGERYLADKYTQALEETDYDKETLRGFAYVCERFDPERRREDLSWSHHRVVAPLPPKEADRWLKLAAKEDWTVKELKRAIKKSKRADDPDDVEEGEPVIQIAMVDEANAAPGEWMERGVLVLADVGRESNKRVFVVARSTEDFKPEVLEPSAVAHFIVEALTKELGV